jgi:hypothetical protein
MKKRFLTASGGVEFTALRAGESSANPINFLEIFKPEFLEDDLEIRFLPGIYEWPELWDLTSNENINVYCEGKVFLKDVEGVLEPAIRVGGSKKTITGIRFRNCKQPIEVADGAEKILIANCIDYHHIDLVVTGGQSFTAKAVTSCVFRNLTCRRDGKGISVLKNTEVYNCLQVGIDEIARPGFFGEMLDAYDSKLGWFSGIQTMPFVVNQLASDYLEGSNLLVFKLSNSTGVTARPRIRKIVSYDLSRGDLVKLAFRLISTNLLVAGADSYRFYFGSGPGDYHRFDLADTDVAAGLNVLSFDLTAPTATVGVPVLGSAEYFLLEVNLQDGGSIEFGLDHLYLADSSLVMNFNAAETVDGVDVYAFFKGANGYDSSALEPPFESPLFERLNYAPTKANFETYMSGGLEGFPIGGMFQGGHIVLSDEPGHLRFTNHPTLGTWTNDEEFYDTDSDQPGVDGEGLAAPIDETGAIFAALNGEVVNLAVANGAGEIRDTDDSQSTKFDKNAGAATVNGIRTTLAAAFNLSAIGAIGVGVEYYIAPGDMTKVTANGLDIIINSAGGSLTGRVLKTELQEGWNRSEVLLADPFASAGVFDATAMTFVDASLNVNAADAMVGHMVDHIYAILVSGSSTAPITFDSLGRAFIDLGLYPEARVARVVSEPFFVRAGALVTAIRSALGAIEDVANGAYVNRTAVQRILSSRTWEVRWADGKYSRYGILVGALAKPYTPISRLSSLKIESGEVWAQVRCYIRNRSEGIP